MADHKWMLIGLQVGFALISLTASKAFDAVDMPHMYVWLGQEVHLPCGDNSSEASGRSWKFEDEDLMIASDRISSINQSSILRIVNVTLDDEGYYTCTAFTQPPQKHTVHLQVKERPCDTPNKPLNGDYESATKGKIWHHIGDTIRYHCNTGYELVGEAIRTCSGTLAGWTPEEPQCQPSAEYMDNLMRRLTDIELNVLNVVVNVSNLETPLSSLESNMSSPRSSNDFKPMRSKRSIANDYEPDRVSQCMAMHLGVRDGHDVSQFKFVVKNFRSKASTSGISTVDSQPFYHKDPGYKYMLRMTISYDYSLFVDLVLLPGDYDNQLTWPIIPRFKLTILKNGGSEMPYQSTYTGDDEKCKERRTKSEKKLSCHGLNPFFTDVFNNEQHIQPDGSVVINIYFEN